MISHTSNTPTAPHALGTNRRVCVIGSGSSGIAAAKILHERGMEFDCFEKGTGIGGMWRFQNDSGSSSAYRSLHINTSRDTMAYSDFPMPADYPPFPSHALILKYFERYVDHFGFRHKLTFSTSVDRVQPLDNGEFDVTITNAEGTQTRRYGAVMVANGHHSKPSLPEFPGKFDGELLHSHYYKTPERFAGKRVVVVGLGNSACDIVCEVSRVAEKTFLSTRSGAHIIPKYLFGIPFDRIAPKFVWRWLPPWALRPSFSLAVLIARGRQQTYGLPVPPHKFLEEHPTLSGEILNMLGHGYIQVRKGIKQLDGRFVEFTDGVREEADTIICATGYKISFPFLDQQIINPVGNQVRLFKQVFHTTIPKLSFIGLVQPWGPIMPLAELQSRWVADVLQGECQLAPRDEMDRVIDKELDVMRRRYAKSERHTIQVDYYPYIAHVGKERRRARRSKLAKGQ